MRERTRCELAVCCRNCGCKLKRQTCDLVVLGCARLAVCIIKREEHDRVLGSGLPRAAGQIGLDADPVRREDPREVHGLRPGKGVFCAERALQIPEGE